MRMKRHFDPEYMEKPKDSEKYQKDPLKRFLGIISPVKKTDLFMMSILKLIF